jgi:hypothetical protein
MQNMDNRALSPAQLQKNYSTQRHKANTKLKKIKNNDYFNLPLCSSAAGLRRRADDSWWFLGAVVCGDLFARKIKN